MANKPGDKVFTNFDGTNVPKDFDFPSLEIESVDRAIFDLFDKQMVFETTEKGKTRKIPVVFASGERFALTRRKNPIRDRNNALILPIISITRGTIDVSPNQHSKGTAISFRPQPGYYIKRRLSEKDRNFQNILNKQGLKNQDNVSSKRNVIDSNTQFKIAQPGTVSTRRPGSGVGFFQNEISLKENLGKNIFEIIELDYPTFMCIEYEITFWTQYIGQANQIIQTILNSFTGQGYEIVTHTKEGFELVAFFADNFLLDTNFSSYTDDERLIKTAAKITVPAYLLNSKQNKGQPSKIRSYFSAPVIDFGYKDIPDGSNIVFDNQEKENINKFLLSDVSNQDKFKEDKKEPSETIETHLNNPFTNKKESYVSKIIQKNKRSGETVLSNVLIKNIDRQYEWYLYKMMINIFKKRR